MLVATLGNYSCKDSYDLDDEQPSGLNSIYGYMSEKGNFTNFLRLIDDLGEKEILSKTGSKTLFVADDAAFAEFLQTNSWGVRKYEDLTLAQKKLLLYSAMIDNPYPTSMLSSAQGPVKGEVCRRASSLSVFDSVQVIYAKDYDKYLPKNEYFDDLIAGRDSIVLFNDGSGAAPMVHFNAQYLTGNKLLSTDIDFLYNQPAGTRLSDDVYVNHSRVINDEGTMNVFCKNGFLHVVDKVITPLENMATIIAKDPKTSIYSAILDRFCVPMDSASLTTDYNNVKNLDSEHRVDDVFLKRYFSKRSIGSNDTQRSGLVADRYNHPAESQLKFDPGWNTYVAEIPNDRVPLMEDMAVMLVPSNDAIQKWWNKEGKVIQDYYAPGITDAAEGLPKVPISVIVELINVNMLNSFASSLPSRFDDVLNDANEAMGLHVDSIDENGVTIGCNGAVYRTSCVYAPTSYSSVLFPAVVDTTNFKIIKKAIDLLEYDAYLNSMVSTYSFFLPTNKGLLSYVDPVSFGQTEGGKPAYQIWEFGLDPSKASEKQIYASVYKCILNDDGTWTKGDLVTTLKDVATSYDAAGGTVTVLSDRFLDMLDNIIVTEPLQAGKSYYKTKGNNYIKVSGNLNVEHEMYASGSWQMERNKPIKVGQIFQMRNGNAYILSDENGTPDVINGTSRSVCKCLAEMPECSDFFEMLQACGAVSSANTKDSWIAGDQQYGNLLAYNAEKKSVTYLLNAYQYTIYAPTNTAMQKAYAMGLPSMADLALAEAYDDEQGGSKASTDSAEHVKAVMLDFVKYHIQDNAIFVDNGFQAGNYESGKTELTPSVDGETGELTGKYSPGRPYKINVNPSADGIVVRDYAFPDKDIHVDMREGMHNVYAREYWFNGNEVKNPYASTINNTSCAVIHAVDAPLLYNYTEGSTDPDKNQFIFKDRAITKESAIKNRSPRKYVRR